MHAHLRARVTGGFAAVALGASAAVTATPAGAATGPVSYSCTSQATGAFPATIDIDTGPATIAAGDDLTSTTNLTFPGSVRQRLYEAGVRIVEGIVDLAVTGSGGLSRQVRHTVSRTVVPDDGPLTLVGSGSLTLATSGQVRLRAGDLAASLQLRDATGDPVGGGPATITCTEPGPDPVIDLVSVTATTGTILAVDQSRVSHGEKVKAVARVATTGGKAKGAVIFRLGGHTDRVWLGNDGVARTALPADLPAGHAYPLTATFEPADVRHVTSSSATASVRVAKDRVNVQVRVADTRRGKRVRARVAVRSVHGEPVHGRIEVVLKRQGDVLRAKTKRLYDGNRNVGLIRLYDPGVYKVRVKFLGQDDFRRSNDREWFRIVGR